ncbi:MAG: hypothetical protein ACQESG_01860 [Nanobdellota archaeon]
MKQWILIPVIMLLVACSQNGQRINEVDIYTGKEGVTMEFGKDTPPEVILEDQEFAAGVLFENKGASDVNESYISLISEDDYLDIVEWRDINTVTTKLGSLTLQGKRQSNPEGERRIGVIQMKSKKLKEMTETHTSIISLNLCYAYSTYFSDSICIDSDVFDMTEKEKACEVQTLSSSGTGAPVAITEVKPKMLSHDSSTITPEFKLTIENMGDGQVIKSSKIEQACTSESFSHKDFNEVTIRVAQMSGHSLECKPNPVKLEDDTAISYCRLPGGVSMDAGNYKTTLNFELDYGYTANLAESVEIRKFIK